MAIDVPQQQNVSFPKWQIQGAPIDLPVSAMFSGLRPQACDPVHGSTAPENQCHIHKLLIYKNLLTLQAAGKMNLSGTVDNDRLKAGQTLNNCEPALDASDEHAGRKAVCHSAVRP